MTLSLAVCRAGEGKGKFDDMPDGDGGDGGYTLGGGGSNYGGGETVVPCYGGSKGDPHLAFAHGGKADFRGKHGAIYCFLSTPGLALNVKTEASTLPTSLQPPRSHTASTLALRCA